jgi:uncharacterized protein (DUF305 family)
MKMSKALITFAVVAALSSTSWSSEYENDDDDRSGHVPVVAHEVFMLAPGETVDPGTVGADLDSAAQMKRHHEGAVTMSTDYLEDPRGTNPISFDLQSKAQSVLASDDAGETWAPLGSTTH